MVARRAPAQAPDGHDGARPVAAARRALPLVAWLGSLVTGVVLFHALGSGPLEPPPLTDPSSWGAWAEAREPVTAVIAVLRLVVLALAWYLVGVTTIGLVARLVRAARLVRLVDALTVPAVRRLLQGALGLSLATAMVGAAAPAGYGGAPPTGTVAGADASDERQLTHVEEVRLARADAEVRLTRADAEVRLARADDVTVRRSRVLAEDEVRLRRVEPVTEPPAAPLPLELLAGAATGEAPGSGDEVVLRQVIEDPVSSAATHEVEAGESLWSIARDTLVAARGQEPDDAVLHTYWGTLIEHNRGRLADAANPDLIFPGQVFELPPTPAAGP
jgi:nucleoid-associated protein YgaU